MARHGYSASVPPSREKITIILVGMGGGGGDGGGGLNLLRNFARAPMSISVLTIFALPNIFLALRSPGPSTATFSFPGGGTFIKTPVNSAVRRSREAPTTGRGLRFIQCYSTA